MKHKQKKKFKLTTDKVINLFCYLVIFGGASFVVFRFITRAYGVEV